MPGHISVPVNSTERPQAYRRASSGDHVYLTAPLDLQREETSGSAAAHTGSMDKSWGAGGCDEDLVEDQNKGYRVCMCITGVSIEGGVQQVF